MVLDLPIAWFEVDCSEHDEAQALDRGIELYGGLLDSYDLPALKRLKVFDMLRRQAALQMSMLSDDVRQVRASISLWNDLRFHVLVQNKPTM